VPLGLIVNELVTNSIKHAFDDAGGAIRVELRSGIGFGQARLAVSDNGRGIPSAQPEGSGLKLIRSLARQVGGKVEQESFADGTKTAVVFPILP